MDNATEVADLLEAAAEVIEERGWCQRSLSTPDGRVCLVGAIKVAAGCALDDWTALASGGYRAVNQRVETTTAWMTGPGWQDAPGREKYEVIDLLKSTAKDLRNEASV